MRSGSTGRGVLHRTFRAFLVTLLALGTPGTGFSVLASEPALEPGAAALSVASDPQGAAVYVNGQLQGATPLTLNGMAPGEHRVRLVKDGFLENSRVVSVKSGQPGTVQVKMTPDRNETRYTLQQEPGEGGGGGSKKALWIGLGVAALGAGAYFLLRDTNDPPSAGTISVSPTGNGLEGATNFTFTSNASDPDGDALTFSWNLGDGGTASGASVSHVYTTAGSQNVSVSVSDGKDSASATASVTVRDLTGSWTGTLGGDLPISVSLTHNNTSVTGSWVDEVNGTLNIAGSVSAPRNISFNLTRPGIADRVTGTVDESINMITGTTNGGLQVRLTRQ